MTFSREFLESNVSAAQIPGGSPLLGALAGIPIVPSEYLRYDEMAFGHMGRSLYVGEERHFLYRMRQLDANHACRQAASAAIKTAARRILGEEWKLSSE